MRPRTVVWIVLGIAAAVLISWLEYRHGMAPIDDVALWSRVRPDW